MKTCSIVLFTFLSLLLAAVPFSIASDTTKVCAACGKPIGSSQVIVADGQYYHLNHFVCAICKKPIGTQTYYRQNGHVYDSLCYVNEILPKCAYCGKPVGDTWVIFDGKQFHDSCYREHVALRCSLCGEIIEGRYLTDQWGNTYHESHRNEPRCLYCGRLLSPGTNGGETYSDGRTICGLCSADAVKSDKEARKIMNEVRQMLAEDGVEIDRDGIPLKLVGADRIARVMGNGRKDIEYDGCTYFEKSKMLYGLISKRKFEISILYGLPRTKYCAAVAHELMHVWLGLQAPMHQNQAMVEGSCNYAASLVLRRLGSDEATRLLENMNESPDPEYGEGYRRVVSQVSARGLAGWLQFLKDHTAAPW